MRLPAKPPRARIGRACRRSRSLLGLGAAVLWGLACQRVPAEEEPPSDGLTEDGEPADGQSAEPVYDCDPTDPSSCGDGQKCTPLDRYGRQNYYECVEEDGTANLFDPCEPDARTGQDGCRSGTVCLADFSDSALCVPLCLRDSDCEDGLCVPDPRQQVPYCANECVPFVSECPSILECRRLDDRTACQFAAEDDVGGSREGCSHRVGDRGCREGFACIEGALVTGCQEARCCTPFCGLGDAGLECTSPDSCNPAFDNPAPSADNVGACYVPA